MLKWFIIGTLLYYAVLLWRYRDSLGTWFTGGKREPEQPESKPTVKAGNGDCLVGASRYRMGQMRTNGDIIKDKGYPQGGMFHEYPNEFSFSENFEDIEEKLAGEKVYDSTDELQEQAKLLAVNLLKVHFSDIRQENQGDKIVVEKTIKTPKGLRL